MTALRRLQKEADTIKSTSSDHFSAGPEGDNLFQWSGMIMGPSASPYEGGVFKFSIVFPTDYPFKRPKIAFETKVYHPNINERGEVCEAILGEWSPSCQVTKILETLFSMFVEPSPDSAVNAEVAQMLKDDKPRFDKNAREWTKKYAQ